MMIIMTIMMLMMIIMTTNGKMAKGARFVDVGALFS